MTADIQLVPTGKKVDDADYAAIALSPHDWHGGWSYDVVATTA